MSGTAADGVSASGTSTSRTSANGTSVDGISVGGTSIGGLEDRIARVALTWLAEPGNRTVWALVHQDGAPATLDRLLTGDVPDRGLRTTVAARAVAGDPRRIAEIALRRGDRLGTRLVVPSDSEWPGRLNDLATLELDASGRVNHDIRPPLCFWVRGEWSLGATLERSVSIIGARAATDYGTNVTGDLAYSVTCEGWTVLSGGAFGIDAAAHRGALAADGRTVAVLACGVERPYPAGNSALLERVAETGLLISEWPIGADPLRHRFLIRNRVIAAATAGTVVVEAAARSGATQTMSRVLALGRPAMVVPGPVTSAMSVGCHEILRSNPGARIVTSAREILEEVGRIGEYLADPPRGPERRHDQLDEESALVLEALPTNRSSTPERIAAEARLTLRTVLRRLSLLEIAGLVVRAGDGYALRHARSEGR